MANIDVQPPTLDLSLYAGDGVEFRIICTNTADEPIDITGSVEAQVKLDRLSADDPIVEFTIDTTEADQGIVGFSLTGDQTMQLVTHPSSKAGKFAGVWDVQWTPSGSQPRTLCQGKVGCTADVTR